MNRIRIIGLVLLIIGIGLPFALESDTIDFIGGAFVGSGIALLVAGRFWWKKEDRAEAP